MKKQVLSIIFAVAIILTAFCGCSGSESKTATSSKSSSSSKSKSKKSDTNSSDNQKSESMYLGIDEEDDEDQHSNVEELTTKAPDTADSDFDADAISSAIKVKGEAFSGSYSNYLILTLTNNSKSDCNLEVNVDLFDSKNNIVGTESNEIEAFGKGTTVAIPIRCDDAFTKYEYTLTASELTYYTPVDQNITCEVTTATKKAIISAKNNGNETAHFVQYVALFYKGKNLVYLNTGYIGDSKSEIKPGKTVKEEASCYEAFDSVKVYIHGRSEANYNLR